MVQRYEIYRYVIQSEAKNLEGIHVYVTEILPMVVRMTITGNDRNYLSHHRFHQLAHMQMPLIFAPEK